MSDSFNNVVSGKLKIKGQALPIKKKKKATENSTKKLQQHLEEKAEKIGVQVINETESERKFREAQEKRMGKKAKELASKSHREKIEDFNTKLSQLSEHNDMPRVGPG